MSKLCFREIKKEDRALWADFELKNKFADTTFTLLYAWKEHFRYELATYDKMVIIRENLGDERYEYIVLGWTGKEELYTALNKLCEDVEGDIILKYISEEQLDSYRCIIEQLGKTFKVNTKDIYSDYIYETEKFMSLEGGINKQKRGNCNWLARNYPNIKFEMYTKDKYNDCIKVFDSWCEWHSCDKCYYGCEREAFINVLEIYDPKIHMIGLSYINGKVASFAVAQQISSEAVSYPFQKNATKIRGLMYWLNREMAKKHDKIKYINLGEDMGIKGITEDKSRLHPCMKLKKYTITIERRNMNRE